MSGADRAFRAGLMIPHVVSRLLSAKHFDVGIRISREIRSRSLPTLRARGSERYGLVASSKAMRLKPHAIDVRVEINPVHWFLSDKDDTRSSYFLEDAATEFQVQGLELDWTCVTWDADLRYRGNSWGFHDFRGSRWTNVNNTDNQR